ncbi:MAG: hypothetical protein QOJ19_2939 [Acidimicrobiia bacterium]|jgi:hypothetical protein|nr:hypothetical protein [Acidimicrobiia bacterium]
MTTEAGTSVLQMNHGRARILASEKEELNGYAVAVRPHPGLMGDVLW